MLLRSPNNLPESVHNDFELGLFIPSCQMLSATFTQKSTSYSFVLVKSHGDCVSGFKAGAVVSNFGLVDTWINGRAHEYISEHARFRHTVLTTSVLVNS